MRTSIVEIREALENYRTAVNDAASASSGLYMAEVMFNAIPEYADERVRNNLMEELTTATVVDINCQFDLMVASKVLDVLIELAKLEIANDRLRQPAK